MKRTSMLDQCLWLANVILQSNGITLKDIQRKYENSRLYEGKMPSKRTFHNHLDAIRDLFSLEIECDQRSNEYYISNKNDLKQQSLTNWLLQAFAVSNILLEMEDMRDRILLEEIPSAKLLPDILEALKEKRKIEITYQPFVTNAPFDRTLQPVFIKFFRRRWYLFATESDNDIKAYSLDRMISVRKTNQTANVAKDFDPELHLRNSLGISVYADIKPCHITIRAYGEEIKYLLTLPMHHSQKQVGKGTVTTAKSTIEEYIDFEYYISPTKDFYQVLLSLGPEIEVISPAPVRKEMIRLVKETKKRYK